MQLRRLAILALAVAACSDDPDVARPEQLRLAIVSGDRQTGPVRPAGGASASLSGAVVPIQSLPPHVLPEPLVARIVIDGGAQASIVGPSAAVLPSNVAVTYRVIQPNDPSGRDCGASFVDAAIPDRDGLVTTYWERGTLAWEECRMEVRLVVDGVPRVDTVFIATFEPGPPVAVGGAHPHWDVTEGEPVDLSQPLYGLLAVDWYYNPIPDEMLVERWMPEWELYGPAEERGRACLGLDTAPLHSSGTGWIMPEGPPYHDYGYCLLLRIEGRVVTHAPFNSRSPYVLEP